MYKKKIFLLFLFASIIFVLIQKQTLWHTQNHKDTLIVGTSADFPPYSFIKNNDFQGFDIELMKAIGEELAMPIKFVDLRFEILIPELQLGSIDIIAACMTETPKRARIVNYTIPYAYDELVIVSRKEKPILDLHELYDQEVAVNEGYYADMYISSLKKISPLRLESVADAMFALKHGRVDAFITASNTIPQIKNSNFFNVMPLQNVRESYSLALSKNNLILLTQINEAIKKLEQNGKLQELKKRWGLVA